MKNFIQEFKEFAVRGSVVDLAVGVIIGGAFGKIVSSLVNDIISPVIGIILGKVNFSDLIVTVGSSTITYGKFLQSTIDFIITAVVIFLLIKGINLLRRKNAKTPAPPAPPTKQEELLIEIRDLLAKK